MTEATTTKSLYDACGVGDFDAVKDLLMDCSKSSCNDVSSLIVASEKGHTSIVNLLLNVGVDVNGTGDAEGNTALIRASRQGQAAVVRLLLSHNADPTQQRNDKVTALYMASQMGHLEICRMLLQHEIVVVDAVVIPEKITPLAVACHFGYDEIIQLLLQHGANPNYVSEEGSTPLMTASREGHASSIPILIEAGADVHVRTHSGMTALTMACRPRCQAVVRSLLANGADVNQVGLANFSPLMIASQAGVTEIVQRLIEKGAVVNFVSENQLTALLLACRVGNVQAADLLITAGADMGFTGAGGLTPILFSIFAEHNEVLELLLRRGAEPDLPSQKDGLTTPLMMTCLAGNLTAARLLIDGGANINHSGAKGFTPVMEAAQHGKSLMVELFLQRGADPNLTSNDGTTTALLIATFRKDVASMEVLLRFGANVNQTAVDGKTSLMMASLAGSLEMVELLMRYGADTETVNKRDEKMTALSLASQNNHSDVVKRLLSARAVAASQMQRKLTVPTIMDPKNAGVPHLQGVSVHWMKTGFMEDVRAAGFDETAKVYEIEDLNGPPGVIRSKGQNVVCPMTNHMGSAYVHALKGEDNVGDATHMLSYTWGYKVGEIVGTLESYCSTKGLDEKRTYFWICCLCNNQNMFETEVSSDVLLEEFKKRVMGIRRLVCMMAPWDEPYYLTRVWCLYEIYTGMTNDLEVSIEMPPEESKRIVDELLTGSNGVGSLEKLYKALAGTAVERAEASKQSDKEMILKLVEDGDGFYETNSQVNEYLRSWVGRMIRMLVDAGELYLMRDNSLMSSENERLRVYSIFLGVMGNLFLENRELEAALAMHKKAFSIQEGKPEMMKELSNSLNSLGLVMHSKGKYKEAMQEYSRAIMIYESGQLGSDEDINHATTYTNAGCSLYALGEYKSALQAHFKALQIEESSKNRREKEIATIHQSIGIVYHRVDEYGLAREHYSKALKIREAILGERNPETAALYNNLGSLEGDLQNPTDALAAFQKSRVINEITLGKRSVEVAANLSNIGTQLSKLEQYDEARENLELALEISTEKLGKRHPETGRVLGNLGSVFSTKEDYDKARIFHEQALSISQQKHGEQHLSTALCYSNLGYVEEMTKSYDLALLFHRKNLEITEAVLEFDDVKTAWAHEAVGNILMKMRRYDEAEEEFRSAWIVFESNLGSGHKHTSYAQYRTGIARVLKVFWCCRPFLHEEGSH